MGQVYDIVKDRRVYSIDADSTVLEAARFMMEHSIGALPVLRNGDIVGIFSERDVMNRVVAAGRMPGTTKVSEVMTANPITVMQGTRVADAVDILRLRKISELPVVDAFGKPAGLLDVTDLIGLVSREEAEHYLRAAG